jgi:tetratricopeptide (TPR) repeat protein
MLTPLMPSKPPISFANTSPEGGTPNHGAAVRSFAFRRRTAGGAIIVLACALTFAGWSFWRWQQLPARVTHALPTMPALVGKPAVLHENLQHASELTRSRDTALEGVAQLGRLYQANGFNAEAEACWNLLIDEQPGVARCHYYLADLRRTASDYEAVADLLARTVKLAPDYAPAVLQLANLEFKSGRLDSAAKLYQRRLTLVPGDPYARLGLARVAMQRGQRTEARDQLVALVKDAPDFPSGHNLYAEILAADGDEKGADHHRWLGREAGRVREPEDPWLVELNDWCFDPERMRLLATIQYQTEQGDRGRQLLERAVELAPESSETHAILGDLYLKLGEYAGARDALRRAIDLAKIRPPSPQTYVSLSHALRELKQPAAAEAAAREGLARLPNAFEIHDALGTTLGELGRPEEAIAAFQAALAAQPNDANTNFNLALVLLGVGRLDDALTHLRQSLVMQPTFPQSLVLLGEIELKMGRVESAEPHIRAAYEAHPNMPRARQLMGLWHLRMGSAAEKRRDFTAAEKHYREGAAADPDEPDLQANLGVLLMVQRRYPDALPALEAYHRLRPDVPQASLFLGQVYAHLRRLDDARRVLAEGEKLAEQANNKTTAEHCREILRSL